MYVLFIIHKEQLEYVPPPPPLCVAIYAYVTVDQ